MVSLSQSIVSKLSSNVVEVMSNKGNPSQSIIIGGILIKWVGYLKFTNKKSEKFRIEKFIQ